MGKCENRRFREMLHRYELGRLPVEEQEELEQHLLECDECFQDFSEFQATVEHIRFSPKVRDAIVQLAGQEEATPAVPKKAGKFRPFLIPASLITALALIILVLNPWHIEFRPTEEAFAAENRLAVLHFENLVDHDDPDRLGEITASLLITDLTDSRYIQMISSQRLFDIMQRLDYQDRASSDPEIASRIAREARAKWLMTGKIVQVDPNIVITYEISDVQDGRVISAKRITGQEQETIFSLVDRITVDIRGSVELPEVAQEETDNLVADITTHSAEAYRYYLEGVEKISKFYTREAIADFNQALEYDSTFAMAYYYLSRYKDTDYINQAVAYSDKTTRLGKYYIEGRQALISGDAETYIDKMKTITVEFPDEKMVFYDLGLTFYERSQFEESKDYLLKAIEIDPSYKGAINSLAYAYDKLGDFENSILAINQYIALVPDEPNPYDSRGDLYAFNGEPEKAIESYMKALEIKPDYYESMRKMGHLFLMQREFDRALQCYTTMLPTADSGYYFRRVYPVLLPCYQGKFDQALSDIDELLEEQKARQEAAGISYSLKIKALIYYQQGNIAQAIDAMAQSVETYYQAYPSTIADDRYLLVQFVAESGDFEQAALILDSLREHLADSKKEVFRYWYALGVKAWAQGEIEKAVDALEMAEKLSIGSSSRFSVGYTLGRVYLEMGKYEQAVAILEDITGDYGESVRLCVGPWNVKSHYYLGLAYENSRWYQKAIEQFQIFLEFWDGADPGIEEVADARQRLERLQSDM